MKRSTVARIVTALLGVPLIIGAVILGDYWFGLAIMLGALAAQNEFLKLYEHAGTIPFRMPALTAGAALIMAPWVSHWEVILLLMLVGMIASMPFIRFGNPLHRASASLFSLAYPVGLFKFLVFIRLGVEMDVSNRQAIWLTLLVFLLVWANDIAAYFGGKHFGKRLLFPSVSPKKTWEGFGAGFVGSALVAVTMKLTALPEISWLDAVAVTLLCSVAGPVGDLAESRFKRAVGMKDAGSLLPGHGGMLDRFDAMIMCAPLVWLYLAYAAF